jgi:hypothetical protein
MYCEQFQQSKASSMITEHIVHADIRSTLHTWAGGRGNAHKRRSSRARCRTRHLLGLQAEVSSPCHSRASRSSAATCPNTWIAVFLSMELRSTRAAAIPPQSLSEMPLSSSTPKIVYRHFAVAKSTACSRSSCCRACALRSCAQQAKPINT